MQQYYYICPTNKDLQHHGIMGMRWGVRRYQNEDGSYTSAGRDRYGIEGTRKKSKHREALESKYKEKGLSQKDAESAADKRIKIEKGIAVGVGVAALAVASYVTYKHIGNEYIGKTIKQGTTLQTLTSNKDRMKVGQDFFASYNKGDKQIYKALLGKEGTENKFNIAQKAVKDIKVAPDKVARDTFTEMYKGNKEFRDYLKTGSNTLNRMNNNSDNIVMMTKKGNALTSNRDIRNKAYSVYNQMLVDHSPETEKFKQEFYGKLKDKGFDAISDLNDRKYSGFNAKDPTIVFNKGKVAVDTITKLKDNEINTAKNIENGKAIGKLYASIGIPYIGVGVTSIALNKYDNKVVEDHKKKKEEK